ncbi:MAG: heme o synthase [Parachlamydiaceae bacterium]
MKTYYMLTKPGIILGNIVTTAAGFVLASKGHVDFLLFLETLLGLAFVIASAGVFNNYIDRAMDAKMERTKNRAFVKKSVNPRSALQFGSFLGMLGMGILAIFTNPLTVFVAFLGFFVYLVLYAFLKYRSFYGTLVGSIAGAVPPVVGYCAVSNRFDTGAFLLFLILVLWQMPHFYAIAIYRIKDYAAASIPVLPIAKGIDVTKREMALYIVAFTATTLLLTMTGYTGYFYLGSALLLGGTWLGLCFKGFKQSNDTLWAKNMFVCSLVVIMALCVTMAFDRTIQ